MKNFVRFGFRNNEESVSKIALGIRTRVNKLASHIKFSFLFRNPSQVLPKTFHTIRI